MTVSYKCTKITYMTYADAEQAIVEHKYTQKKKSFNQRQKYNKGFRIYQCHNCMYFHLTSMSKQQVRRIKKKIKRRLENE